MSIQLTVWCLILISIFEVLSSIDKRCRLTLLQAGNVLRQNGVSDIHHFLINSQIAWPVMYHFDTHCCRIWIEDKDCQFNSTCNSFNEGSETNPNVWYSTFLELDIQADPNVATDACDAACVGIIAICVLTIAAVLIAMILLGRSKKKEKKRKGIQWWLIVIIFARKFSIKINCKRRQCTHVFQVRLGNC